MAVNVLICFSVLSISVYSLSLLFTLYSNDRGTFPVTTGFLVIQVSF